jgi:uncharacterized small protein (DUF1192 family)
MRLPNIQLPKIPEEAKTPFILELVEIIEQLSVANLLQAEEIQLLKDEIARLKGQKPKPNIQPSKLEKDPKKKEKPSSGKRPGSSKREKTPNLVIHEHIRIRPELVPEGSILKDIQPYSVQGLKIQPHNICYLLERWQTPDGRNIVGKLPSHVQGHFDVGLKAYILYQHNQCQVTQPLLLEQLQEWGIDISAGQLNRILTEQKDVFHNEKDEILLTGLKVSAYVHVDDTGARHNGKNGYCTHIGNEWFAWFQSTNSKSRINFLELLRTGQTDYVITEDALQYMDNQGLAKSILHSLNNHPKKEFTDLAEWNAHLKELKIVNHRHIKIATEGALIGSLVYHGLPKHLVIVSDDAGQFNILNHSLCWIHAERTLNKLIAPNEEKRQILESVRKQVWDFYDDLKAYKTSPDPTQKIELENRFDAIFNQQTGYQMLNLALKRLYENKAELLLVLDRPELPLHNNLSENDIREYVKRRKISGSTRSELGRRCRDTFTSLKKTCRKLGVSFWNYLLDRLSNATNIPPLQEIIAQCANPP